MTQLRHKEQVRLTPPPARISHALDWVLTILGIAAGGLGGYLYFADPTRTVTLFGWESSLGDIAEGWGFGLLIAGGLLLFGAFAIYARKVYRSDTRWSLRAVTGTILATAAVAWALTFALIWII